MENATAEVRWNERVEPGVRIAIRGEETLMGGFPCPGEGDVGG